MPTELIAFSEEQLKGIVTGIFATFILFLIGLWFFDFISGGTGK